MGGGAPSGTALKGLWGYASVESSFSVEIFLFENLMFLIGKGMSIVFWYNILLELVKTDTLIKQTNPQFTKLNFKVHPMAYPHI